MTEQSLSKLIVNTNKRFLLPKENEVLKYLEVLHEDQLISSAELKKLGMLIKNFSLADQIAAWEIPIEQSFNCGRGYSFLFKRNAVIDRLGKSYLVPFSFLREVIDIHYGYTSNLWIKNKGLNSSCLGGMVFVIRGEVKRLFTKPIPDPKLTAPQPLALDLQSPPPAVPDGDPLNHSHGPIIETDNHVPPPQLPVIDLAPRCAPLVTTLDEVNLALLKQIRDMLERCESLMKDADNSYELMIKQNRHIFKATEKINSNLETLVKEFA